MWCKARRASKLRISVAPDHSGVTRKTRLTAGFFSPFHWPNWFARHMLYTESKEKSAELLRLAVGAGAVVDLGDGNRLEVLGLN